MRDAVAVTGSISLRPQQQQRGGGGGGEDVELNVTGVRVLNPAVPLPFKFGDKAPSEVLWASPLSRCSCLTPPPPPPPPPSPPPPLPSPPPQELRLMHRPLDLRRPDLQRNLAVR